MVRRYLLAPRLLLSVRSAVEPVFDEGTLLVDTDMTLNLTLTQPNLTVPGNLFVASNASVFLTNTSHLVVQGNFTLDATAVLVLDASGENGNASAPIQVGGCLELLGPITLHTGYISDTTLYPARPPNAPRPTA